MVFLPYKISFLELPVPFLSNITKTPEQSCSTIVLDQSSFKVEWSHAKHALKRWIRLVAFFDYHKKEHFNRVVDYYAKRIVWLDLRV
jgi:hypothetical protein